MKIINRYVLKEHIGPFVFALSAATSLLLLQYIARKFGDLVGKGLRWQVIAEFLLLSVPLTIALTMPMAVLVAVLYAFSRLASENEITALKAGGISTRRLMVPVLGAATALAAFMLWFNDRVLPEANHELATLTIAIMRTKPTFGLKEQVVNAVKESQLYLRAGWIARDESGQMRDVTIYDLSDAGKRKTIYGATGTLAFASNQRDLLLHLYNGVMLSVPTGQPDQLDRLYFREDQLRVRDVANSFQAVDADSSSKGDREMGICEMQGQLDVAYNDVRRARQDSINSAKPAVVLREAPVAPVKAGQKPPPPPSAGGLGAFYCRYIDPHLHLKQAHAAEPPQAGGSGSAQPARPLVNPSVLPRALQIPGNAPPNANSLAMSEAKMRLDDARYRERRYGIEINKKFSLAAACIVFVIVGAPIALRFPRGGIGFVFALSFSIFAIYYVALNAGEALADHGLMSPFWSMWAANVLFLLIGLAMLPGMGHEGVTSRGGNAGEMIDNVRAWFAARRARGASVAAEGRAS